MPTALAIAAHPDDIEFVMAGTLLLLKEAGWKIHYLNLTNGDMGSTVMTAAQTARVRRQEARAAARLLGAKWHAPFCPDLGVFYTEKNIRRVSAIVRQTKPSVVLTHALADYMEDHMATARLAVTGTFTRGVPNYRSIPARPATLESCVLYHAMPHGQCTPTREPVQPEIYVDTSSVHEAKRAALACHTSQKEWLDATQGMDSYVATMDGFSGKLGKQSRKFKQAEGWTRHLHFGFGAEEDDPLRDVLGKKYLRNPKRPMNLRTSSISPDWWDYTCLPLDIVEEVARLTPRDLEKLSRPGFRVVFYDTLEDFYLAEALEYIHAWKQSTDDNPAGICGPIGPTEQLPLVARLVTELGLDVRSGHFWGMDEWFDVETGKEMPVTHPLSFERADREMCFNRIPKKQRMPDAHLHFPKADTAAYSKTYDAGVRCAVMQGGQGDVKHWAFNDPLPRKGKYKAAPPTPAEYRKLATRVVDLHPLTIAQNARTSGGGNIAMVPTRAITVGPVETWKAEKVSIWQAGTHDNPFGQRLTAYLISKRLATACVPMSLLADHPNVQFNYYRGGLGTCAVEMH